MRPVLEYDGDVISGVEGSEFSHGAGVARSGHDLDKKDARNSIVDNCPNLPSVGSRDLPLETVLDSECLGLLIYLTPCLKSKKEN